MRAIDGESGERFEVRAANVVNATGVWADELRPAGAPRRGRAAAHPAQPRHPRHALTARTCRSSAARSSRRAAGATIFALPWLGHTLVGTTDNDYEGPLDHVKPSGEDVDYLLEAINAFFGLTLGPAQLTGAFAGVRPLISTGDPKKSVDISRKAELYETSSGMITITGGKLTTWRRMAKMTVDRLVERDARDAPCRTQEIPLGQAIAVEELPRVEGVPGRVLPGARLALRLRRPRGARAGGRARRARPADRPRPARPARRGRAGGSPRAGAQHRRRAAAAHPPGPARRARARAGDGARTAPVPARGPVERVGDVLARELGWSPERLALELRRFAEEADAEGIVVDAAVAGSSRGGAAPPTPAP